MALLTPSTQWVLAPAQVRIVPGAGYPAEGKSHSSFSLQCAQGTGQALSQNLPLDNSLQPGGVLGGEGRNRWTRRVEKSSQDLWRSCQRACCLVQLCTGVPFSLLKTQFNENIHTVCSVKNFPDYKIPQKFRLEGASGVPLLKASPIRRSCSGPCPVQF